MPVFATLRASVFPMLRQVEPIIMVEQLGSTLYDTALMMVAKDRTANATELGISNEDSQQKALTNFYMIYSLIIMFVPILPSLLLGRLSDRGWRRTPIVVSLSGYLMSRLLLLFVVVYNLSLDVMFGAAVLFGLSGGYGTFWSGVMTVISLGSTATERSAVMMRVELLYGLTGLVGSLVSGHLFQLYSSSLGNGTILIIVSTVLYLICLLFAAALLQVKQLREEPEENHSIIIPSCWSLNGINKINLSLLFLAAFLYDFAVGGAINILGSFVVKAPLSWTATEIGYGNAAGCSIFLTSFLGVIVFRRWVRDEMLILIGMLSFASGIYVMSFVKTTLLFYIARLLNLFALIPVPTIRSLLSQHVPSSLCGMTLTLLQLTLKIAGLVYIPAFTKVYQDSLDWYPGLVFLLASVITVLGMIPISILRYRMP